MLSNISAKFNLSPNKMQTASITKTTKCGGFDVPLNSTISCFVIEFSAVSAASKAGIAASKSCWTS